MKKFLTTAEAAELLRLQPNTLEIWRGQGRGPRYRKFGRRVLYALDDLEAYSASCMVETDNSPVPLALLPYELKEFKA